MRIYIRFFILALTGAAAILAMILTPALDQGRV
jgi:hypothetical protein